MPFNSPLPQWNKTATAPTQTKMDNGWAAQEHPPASIFNWFFNTVYLALQELQNEAVNTDQKGVANGVATLDATGDLPIGQADNILNWVKGFGLGDIAKDISSTDLNNLDATGFYKGSTLTNSPNGTGFFFILNFKHSSTFKGQIALTYSQGSTINQLYFRNIGSSGAWTSWTQLAQYDATGKIAIANLPAATTALAGITQLVDSITDTSANKAATPNSVKMVVDWAKGYGLGDVAKDISNTDLNALDATGFYRGTNLTNRPTGTTTDWFFVINIKHNTNYKMQYALSFNTTAVYVRSSNSIGVWLPWAQQATYDSNSKIAIANLPAATTALAGIAQLVDSITDTSTNKAATPNSVKLLQDWVKGFGGGDIGKAATDANALDVSGFYSFTTATPSNLPVNDGTFFSVLNIKTGSTSRTQIAINVSTGDEFTRKQLSGTWGAWVQTAKYDANGKIATANLPDATTAAKGITQLVDNYTTADSTKAATANAVKTLQDFIIGYGLGSSAKILSNGDANALDATGFYYIDGATSLNTPTPGSVGYYIVHVKNSANFKMQLAQAYNNSALYFRANNNGTWTAWKTIATTDKTQMYKLTDDTGYAFTSITGTDLNLLVTSGFYYGNNLINSPDGSTNYYRVLSFMASAISGMQMATLNGGDQWIRNMAGGVWGRWVKQLNDNAPTWTNLTLQNGVLIYSGGTTPQYTKIGNVVFIRGAVKNITTTNIVMATLPVGFRPATTSVSFALPMSNNNGAKFARWTIGTDGTITLEGVTDNVSTSGLWYPVNMSFVAEG